MNYTQTTLGELLSSDNPAIKRNATGILRQMQKCDHTETKEIKTEGFWETRCSNCGIILQTSTHNKKGER